MAVLRRVLRDESGHGMTEYAILIGMLALGAIVTLLLIGTRIRSAFSPPETPVAGASSSLQGSPPAGCASGDCRTD